VYKSLSFIKYNKVTPGIEDVGNQIFKLVVGKKIGREEIFCEQRRGLENSAILEALG